MLIDLVLSYLWLPFSLLLGFLITPDFSYPQVEDD